MRSQCLEIRKNQRRYSTCIPLVSYIRKTTVTPSPLHQRHRSNAEDEDDDSSEDNVSIVSRSPSPVSEKDVEMKDINLYDEHVRKPSRETITVETKIKSSNKGFAMLAKMGWTEGTPLGVSGEGKNKLLR